MSFFFFFPVRVFFCPRCFFFVPTAAHFFYSLPLFCPMFFFFVLRPAVCSTQGRVLNGQPELGGKMKKKKKKKKRSFGQKMEKQAGKRQTPSNALQAIKRLASKSKQGTNYPILRSHQTRPTTISRRSMAMEFMVFTVFVCGRMERVANVVHPSQVGGLSIFITRVFAYRKWRFLCKRRGCEQCTAPRTLHTRKHFLACGSRI